MWNPHTLELQEELKVLFLNNANQVIGLYPQSIGSITSTTVDIRLILSAALNCAAVGFILSHNHPSGKLKPSYKDIQLTHKLQSAAKMFDLPLLDHIIITKDDYYSFADHGDLDF